MKESAIEAWMVRAIRSRGGLCYKWVSPGTTGVPDRIVILPGGRTIYVELKTEVGRLSEIQKPWVTLTARPLSRKSSA